MTRASKKRARRKALALVMAALTPELARRLRDAPAAVVDAALESVIDGTNTPAHAAEAFAAALAMAENERVDRAEAFGFMRALAARHRGDIKSN